MNATIAMYLHTGQVQYQIRYKEAVFVCTAVGISGTTKVFVRETRDDAEQPLFTARMGISIMGTTNRKLAELASANPFDLDFRDNFAEGIGNTEAEALADLKHDVDSLSRTLFL